MVVGKTASSISMTEIFSKFSEAQVLCSVFPEITEIPCIINSPLRDDRHPSFSIYLDNGGHIRYKDHACPSIHGGIIDLLCAYWSCTFNQALDKICKMMIKNDDVTIKPKQIKTFTRKEANLLTKIEVKVRPWRDYDYEYWESYGITKQWLKYAEIYPISYKIVTKKVSLTDKGRKFIFPTDKHAYAFVNRKEGKLSLKIYQPYNTKGFKWCSKADKSIIDLWDKIPEYGDKVIICSSMKDALCISCNLHIPTLALQGEGYNMSQTAIKELKRRYKQIYISFDTDSPGIKDAQKLAKETGFTNIVPNLRDCKDYSDAYKAYGKEWFVETLGKLF